MTTGKTPTRSLPEGVQLVKLTDGGYLILLNGREIGEVHKDRMAMWYIRWPDADDVINDPYFSRTQAVRSMVQIVTRPT